MDYISREWPPFSIPFSMPECLFGGRELLRCLDEEAYTCCGMSLPYCACIVIAALLLPHNTVSVRVCNRHFNLQLKSVEDGFELTVMLFEFLYISFASRPLEKSWTSLESFLFGFNPVSICYHRQNAQCSHHSRSLLFGQCPCRCFHERHVLQGRECNRTR